VTIRQFVTSGFDSALAIGAGIPQISHRFLNQRFKNQRSIRYAGSNGIQFLPDQPPVRSFVGAPIIHQGQTRGWLYLADKLDAPEFSAADERFTVTLTQAIVFYENARLYADLRGHAAALEQEIADRKLAEKQRAEMLTRAQAAQAEAERQIASRTNSSPLFRTNCAPP
jgi:GAF domain-containing protein